MTPDALHMWRRQRRLTQPALADLLGISTQQVSRMENGHIEIPRWLPLALAGIDVNEIEDPDELARVRLTATTNGR